jgi:nucleoside-diphosphate-sugar epimerase
MAAYIAVRAEGEVLIAAAQLTATILRPWYVLGPGHRWPLALIPIYAVARKIPALREGAERLGLVTVAQMVSALTLAVEIPPARGTRRVVSVPGIRGAALRAASAVDGRI